MVAPDAPDLLGLGTLCSAPTCACRDFLPFVCAGCARSFCAEHRAPSAHACAVPEKLGRIVVACPVCAKGVELPSSVRPDDEAGVSAVVDAHMRSTACNPANYARVHAKPRCPAPGCKAALTVVNSYTCKNCGSTVCLAHRHGSDHACAGMVAAARAGGSSKAGAAAALRSLRAAFQRPGSAKAAAPPPPPAPRPPPVSAALAAAAAAQRLVGGGSGGAATTSPRSAAAAAAERRAAGVTPAAVPPPPQPTTSPRARCPVCGLGCGSARALRAHHAAAHPGAAPLPVCVLS